MAIKVRNSSGSWDTVDEARVHNGTSFDRTKRVLEHNGSSFVEQHRSDWSYTFTTTNGIDDGPTHKQVNLETLTGIDKFYDVTITIDSGVTIYSDDTTIPAFKTGGSEGDEYGGTLTIINNGSIYGAGGTGGDGGAVAPTCNDALCGGGDGEDGGTALYLETNITLTDNGSILGGGGGGGGGGGSEDDQEGSIHEYAGGGGGGGGASFGIGGTRDSSCSGSTGCTSASEDGNTGTVSTGGEGGLGADAKRAIGGKGGNGGNPGESGGEGQHPHEISGYFDSAGAGGDGGLAGTSIEDNGFTTV